MDKKCTHETSICIAEYDGFYVCACTWGCGTALIVLKLENHTVITFTAAELVALKAWRDEVAECCIVDFVPITTPQETLHALIAWNIKMALDPQISGEANKLTRLQDKKLAALKAERDNYRKRVSMLENIIQAARNGEYENAHEINAIRKFLRESMLEYYRTPKGEK